MKEVVAVILQNDRACVYCATVKDGVWTLDSDPIAVFPGTTSGKQEAKIFAEQFAESRFEEVQNG